MSSLGAGSNCSAIPGERSAKASIMAGSRMFCQALKDIMGPRFTRVNDSTSQRGYKNQNIDAVSRSQSAPSHYVKPSSPEKECLNQADVAISRSHSAPSQCMKMSTLGKNCVNQPENGFLDSKSPSTQEQKNSNLQTGFTYQTENGFSDSKSPLIQDQKDSTLQTGFTYQSENSFSRSKSAPSHDEKNSHQTGFKSQIENGFIRSKSTPSQDEKNSHQTGFKTQTENAFVHSKSALSQDQKNCTLQNGFQNQIHSEQQIKETKSEIKLPRRSTYPFQQYKDEDVNCRLFPNKSVCSTNAPLPNINLHLPTDDSYTLPICGFHSSSQLKQDTPSPLIDPSDYTLPVMSSNQPTASKEVKTEAFCNGSPLVDYNLPVKRAVEPVNLNASKQKVSHELEILDDYSLPMTCALIRSMNFSMSNEMYGLNSLLDDSKLNPSSGSSSSYDSDINVDSQGDSCSDTVSEVGENASFLETTLSLSKQVISLYSQEVPPEDSVIQEEKSETLEKISPYKSDNIPSNAVCESCDADETLYRREDRLRNQSHRKSILPRYDASSLLTLKSEHGFIDAHCHLDFLLQRQNYDGTYSDYQELHKDTFPVSYQGCVAVFCNPYSFYKKSMWQKYLAEKNVWAAFGCHPHNAQDYCDAHEKYLCEALDHSQVRALGEIGVDYSSRNNCSKEIQHKVFRRQLNIALSRKLPLVIHCRDAYSDTLTIMKEVLPKNYKIHLHCFADEWKYADEFLVAFPSLFIGLTNLVTFHSADDVHEVAKRVPLNRLLLETDAPYFVPRVYAKGTRWSHPGMAIHVAAQIAKLKNCSLDEVLYWTRKNTENMYGI